MYKDPALVGRDTNPTNPIGLRATNCQPATSYANRLRNKWSQAQGGSMGKIAGFVGAPGVDDHATLFLNTRAFFPTFTKKSWINKTTTAKGNNFDSLSTQQLKVFTQFNATPYYENQTQDEWEDQFERYGFSVNPFTHGDAAQHEVGIGVSLTGQASTHHTGTKHIRIAKKILLRYPPISSEARRKLVSDRQDANGITATLPAGLFAATLEELDFPAHVKQTGAKAITQALRRFRGEQSGAPLLPVDLKQASGPWKGPNKPSFLEIAGLQAIRRDLVIIVAALAHLQLADLITLNGGATMATVVESLGLGTAPANNDVQGPLLKNIYRSHLAHHDQYTPDALRVMSTGDEQMNARVSEQIAGGGSLSTNPVVQLLERKLDDDTDHHQLMLIQKTLEMTFGVCTEPSQPGGLTRFSKA